MILKHQCTSTVSQVCTRSTNKYGISLSHRTMRYKSEPARNGSAGDREEQYLSSPVRTPLLLGPHPRRPAIAHKITRGSAPIIFHRMSRGRHSCEANTSRSRLTQLNMLRTDTDAKVIPKFWNVLNFENYHICSHIVLTGALARCVACDNSDDMC